MLSESKEVEILNIVEDLQELCVGFLPDIMNSKTVNEDLEKQLYMHLTKLKELIQDEKYIPREISGFLFSIYLIIASEAEHLKSPIENRPLFMLVAKLQVYLQDIFGKSKI
ncbi:hypothetical protein VQL36_03950 [Chengkuizengella sp. SCS-71B]|uniref:hypothetical protein n=1 Tax=Chengkuizengella sp. SCS-71B TaxID=3115290 RepID=UPI0032C21E24